MPHYDDGIDTYVYPSSLSPHYVISYLFWGRVAYRFFTSSRSRGDAITQTVVRRIDNYTSWSLTAVDLLGAVVTVMPKPACHESESSIILSMCNTTQRRCSGRKSFGLHSRKVVLQPCFRSCFRSPWSAYTLEKWCCNGGLRVI